MSDTPERPDVPCRLTYDSRCPGGRTADYHVRWTLRVDPNPVECTSTLCAECLDGRPDIILVLGTRPVREGDTPSA